MRNILRIALLVGISLAVQLPLLAAPAADDPQTVNDAVTIDFVAPPAFKYSAVDIDVLALDLPAGPWVASTVRIVNLFDPNLDTYLTKYVEPDQGIWEVGTTPSSPTEGWISFTPCTGSGTPDPECTEALDSDMPFPIDYVVEDTFGVPSNPAQVSVTYEELSPLNESLAHFSSNRVNGWTNFVWVMATENGNAGFNILIEIDGAMEPINEQLIASRVIDSPEPQLYEYSAQVDADTFYLQEVSVNGGVASPSGPFSLGESWGTNPFEETNHQDTQIFLPLVSS